MNISTRLRGKHLIFDMRSDITNENAVELKEFILAHLDPKAKAVVLNLKDVSYVNSFALSILISILKELEPKKYRFYLLAPQPSVHSLLKLTQLLSAFKIARDEDQLDGM
jgi:anti-anti-sigma factor